MELLINQDAIVKRELYKEYKFDILQALSGDINLIHYPLIKILCFQLINYCTTQNSTYRDEESFSFEVLSSEKNLKVKLVTLRDLNISDQCINEHNLFFSNFFSKTNKNEKEKVTTINQNMLKKVLDDIQKKHYNILTNDVAVEIKSPIGTAQSSFNHAMCGVNKNFFSDIRTNSVSEILAQI